MATGTPQPDPPPAQMLIPGLRWRRVFPGKERQLGLLRRWLAELLPPCEARDDIATVATELGSNTIKHTASGQAGGWFAVEITWHPQAVLIAVADCGGPAMAHQASVECPNQAGTPANRRASAASPSRTAAW